MGVFSWLKETLEQNQQDGCEPTPEAKNFVKNYDDQVEDAKQSLKEYQERERQERASEGNR